MNPPPHSDTRVDIIPPPETKNTKETDTYKPIAHRTRARRTMSDTPTLLAHEPVARRTGSQINPKGIAQKVDIIPREASQRQSHQAFIHKWAVPIMDTVTGETLEHLQIRRHPKYNKTWNQSYSSELGRLCQGIGKGSKGPKQQLVEGTDTFQIIQYKDTTLDRRNKITYTKVV